MPVSRGRKAKAKRSRSRSTAPSVNSLYAELIRSFRPLPSGAEPLDAEIFTSGLLGTWWTAMPPGEDPDEMLVDAVAYARDRRTPEATAFLCALAELGLTEETRRAAAAGAAELAARGVARPGWADSIGRATVGDCWQLVDVYGDQASLCCEFTLGESAHALMALVDFNGPGPWVKDVWLSGEPATVLTEMREQAQTQPQMLTLDRIAPIEVRRLLETALIDADPADADPVDPDPADADPADAGPLDPMNRPDPADIGDTADIGDAADIDPWDEPNSLAEYRAVALARCRTLPDPGPVADPPEITDADMEALVTEFLAAPEAAALADEANTALCARLIVDFEADQDPERMLRVSPAKAEIFLMDWLPSEAGLDEAARQAMPAVLLAWTRWAAARQNLPEAAVAELVEVVEAASEHFAEVYEGSRGDVIRMYLKGLDVSGDARVKTLERRTFAVPHLDASIGDDTFTHLDPNDEDDRRLLIEGEHPQWHDLLHDPSFEGTVDGVNPRLHIAMHEIVANQLWADDPPEAWAAIERLIAAGVDRHDALHEVMGLVTESIHVALAERERADPGAYVRALDRLGRDRAPRQRAARRPAAGGYQLKIGLRGSQPPIWRRLEVPAGLTLAQLHDAIQAAFGWEDMHLHLFETGGGRRYGAAGPDIDGFDVGPGEKVTDERKARLGQVITMAGDRLSYTYDFGDGWEHDILVEKILPDAVEGPRCTGGRRAAPPEDCGGIWGYAELCEIMADPAHPEHDEQREWLGHELDPEAFDIGEVNTALRGIRATRRG